MPSGINHPSQSEPGKKLSEHKLVIRISSLVTMLFLTLAAIALAYVTGVMSGRNSKHVELPTPAAEAKTENISTLTPNKENLETEERKILCAEDLQFVQALRKDGNQPLKKISTSKEAASNPVAPEPEGAPNKPNEKQTTVSGEAITPPQIDLAKKLREDTSMFDYVFQVGAFRDETSVDNLRQRLEGAGLRTTMQRDGKVILVFVRLRGNGERAAEVINLAKTLGLGEPVMRSRTQVKE